ncbi:MAG: restriction endonuclease subunit S [Flavobacteriaceae bacterium]|nr:restriction endonuclease subunit S [Flavobacteriaceae bacterium]
MNSFKLKDLIKIHNGTKYSHLQSGNVPLYGSGGLMSYVNAFLYDGEVILLPRKGTLSNIMYFNGKIWTVDTMYYATTNQKVNPYYLYCYLSILNLKHLDSGSTLPSMTKSAYDNLEIKLPSLDTQQIIANVLSNLDTKIELNGKINQELETMAKMLYDYWFVQFDFPDKNSKPYKSNGGKMAYNEELKHDIPKGWEVKKLVEIENNIITGKTPSTKKHEYFNGEIPFICIGDVRGNMHIVKTEMLLSGLGANSQENKFIPKGAICVTCIATVGLVAFASENSQTNQQLNTIVCNNFENRYYLYFYLQNYFKFSNAKTGNTFANMNKGDFSSIKVIKPNEKTLINFSETLKSTIDQIYINLKENEQLSKLRDWLLPMLMNGQVTVKQAEEQLAMVAEPQAVYKKEKIVKLSISQELEEKHFLKRKILASYIINQSLNDSQFGDVKFEKLLHLADYYVIQRNLGQKYFKKAAGPYDNTFTYAYFQQVLKAKWYYKERLGNLNRIKAGVNQSKSINTYGHFSQEELNQVNELINKFKNSNYQIPEIISTLYAVWNNRMLKKQAITDELLKEDFLNWDKQKIKYIDRIQRALTWMRENKIIPNGWGNVIEKATKK